LEWGEGGCSVAFWAWFEIILKRGDSKLVYAECYQRGFGRVLSSNERAFGILQLQASCGAWLFLAKMPPKNKTMQARR
jgi:hypothetical protein